MDYREAFEKIIEQQLARIEKMKAAANGLLGM